MTKKTNKKARLNPLSKSPYVRRSKEEMELIVGEIQSGAIAIRTACIKYGMNRNTLKLWMTRLIVGSLTDKTNKLISSGMKDDKQDYQHQIRQLEKALEYAKLKILGLETMIKVTEEEFQIKIRKKPGTKQSKK